MLTSRSVPRCTVIPELVYPDVQKAVKWLCDTFGFTLRTGMGSHRAQLNVGDGAVVLMELRGGNESRGYVMFALRMFIAIVSKRANVERESCASPLIIRMGSGNTTSRILPVTSGPSPSPLRTSTPANSAENQGTFSADCFRSSSVQK